MKLSQKSLDTMHALKLSFGLDEGSGYTRSLGADKAALLNQREALSLDIQHGFLLVPRTSLPLELSSTL